jgi:hypothetical protein
MKAFAGVTDNEAEWPEAEGLDTLKADSQSERKRRNGETEKGRNNKELKARRSS